MEEGNGSGGEEVMEEGDGETRNMLGSFGC